MESLLEEVLNIQGMLALMNSNFQALRNELSVMFGSKFADSSVQVQHRKLNGMVWLMEVNLQATSQQLSYNIEAARLHLKRSDVHLTTLKQLEVQSAIQHPLSLPVSATLRAQPLCPTSPSPPPSPGQQQSPPSPSGPQQSPPPPLQTSETLEYTSEANQAPGKCFHIVVCNKNYNTSLTNFRISRKRSRESEEGKEEEHTQGTQRETRKKQTPKA